MTQHLKERGEGERGGRGAGNRRRGSDPDDPAPTSAPLIGATGQWGQMRGRDYVTASVTPISASVVKK